MRSLMEAPAELTITQTEGEIAVMPKDGPLEILHPDGKKHKNDTGSSEVKTSWDKSRLVVETKRERGPKVTETFSLSPDRKQLLVQVRFEGRADVTVKRVYDAETAE